MAKFLITLGYQMKCLDMFPNGPRRQCRDRKNRRFSTWDHLHKTFDFSRTTRATEKFVYFYFFEVKIFYVRGLVSTGAVGASAPMIFQVVGASKTNFCGF